MEQKPKLFIYGRKEMVVLILLTLLVAAFAFTLGVHLGKRVSTKVVIQEGGETPPAETLPDKVPSKQEIVDQGKGSAEATDEALNQTLHNEVARTGVRLEDSRESELPRHSRPEALKKSEDKETSVSNENEHPAPSHATGSAEKAKPHKSAAVSEKEKHSAITSESGGQEGSESSSSEVSDKVGGFSIQLASYKTQKEALTFSQSVEHDSGLETFIRAAEVKNKGKWFRVYTGQYESRKEAEKAAENYKKAGKLQTFVISKVE